MAIIARVSSYLSILLLLCTVTASAQTSHEFQVKAAFVYNLTHFVEWPSTAFTNSNAPIVIGVLGKNPFGNVLKEMVAGERIGGHPMVVIHFTDVEKAKNCHLLYINLEERNEIIAVINRLRGHNILMVGDAPGFAKMGGMVRLFTKNDKINIEINLEEARKERLQISSKLLKLSQIVHTE
jgi:hypothetical protein